MVDQERLENYIKLGFDKEKAFEMCQAEDIEAKKEAAKAAKAEAAAKPDKVEEAIEEATEDKELQFVKKEDIKSVVADTIKTLKDDEEFKNILNNEGTETQKERTVEVIIEEAVNKMRTGK